VNECKPLTMGRQSEGASVVTRTGAVRNGSGRKQKWEREAGAYTRPLFGLTQARFVGDVGCTIYPLSIRQGDTGRCDEKA